MRGRPSVSSNFFSFLRNTPAYAGKTSPAGAQSRSGRKHPRVCGEDMHGQMTIPGTGETPPRMRGRPRMVAATVDESGNTPAYAGKTIRI